MSRSRLIRGEATYAYPLPKARRGRIHLKDRTRAGARRQNESASPSYVEVSATPSATLSVKQSGDTVARANWGAIVSKGSAAGPRARIELIDPGKNWVNVSVVDDDTDQPVPCRIHFRSLDGVPYQPHGFPQSRQLQSRHVAQGRWRRPAPGADHLCLHRRHVPGMASARRGDRRRGAGVRVRAASREGPDPARSAATEPAPETLDEHERSSGGSAETRTSTSSRRRALTASRRPRT